MARWGIYDYAICPEEYIEYLGVPPEYKTEYKKLKISRKEIFSYFQQSLQSFRKVLSLTKDKSYSKIRYEAKKRIKELKEELEKERE